MASTTDNTNFGLSPGTLVYIGPAVNMPTEIKLINYNENYHWEQYIQDITQYEYVADGHISWLDIDGIHEPNIIKEVGTKYQIDSLSLEDIMNTTQKAKIETFDNENYIFIVVKMLHLQESQQDKLDFEIDAEHVSFILGKDFLISFQERRTTDIFQNVLNRIKASVGKTRKNGADYLLYSLLDLIVDNYLLVLEEITEKLENLEEQIFKSNRSNPVEELYLLKRELTLMRKYIIPLREVLTVIMRGDSPLIKSTTHIYFRDLQDHVLQAIDSIDSQRELLTGLIDIHYSTLSTRMNSIMKTLTIYTAIFMPLTLIAGIYGMNFDVMPELRNPHGYYYTLGGMLVVTIGLLLYFRRRGWL